MNTTIVRRSALPALLLSAALLAGCGGGEAAEAETEHESTAVTQWNGATELFMEYPPLVAGQKTGNWAIHLTEMRGFKPITSGTLDVRFLDAGGREAARFNIPAPASNGIFLLDPPAPPAGTYRVELALRSPQATSSHVLPAVRVYPN